jgi:hypothetical protein
MRYFPEIKLKLVVITANPTIFSMLSICIA